MPTVTVLIPSYNRASLIGETLESALNQSHPADEILVVDDGSDDATEEVARSYAGVRFAQKDHSGAPDTRNLGLALSRCDYVVSVGSDDVMLADCLRNLHRAWQAVPDLDLYYGDLIATDAFLNPQKRIRYPQWKDRFNAMVSTMAFTNQIGDGFAMAKKSWVIERGGHSNDFSRCQDWDLWARSSASFSLLHVGCDLGYWRWHDDNLSANRKSQSKVSFDREIRERVRASKPTKEHFRDLGWEWVLQADRKRPLFIWGAGEYGEAVRLLLAHGDLEPMAFIDSDDSKVGAFIDGLEIRSPQWLRNSRLPKPIVAIASVYESEIAECIESFGYREGIDYFRPHCVEYRRLSL